MRLVDAHQIEGVLRYTEFDRDERVSWIDAYRHFLEIVENAPTSYDVDKVAELLNSEADRWEESGRTYEDEKEIGVAEGYRKAVKIVKAGMEIGERK